MRQHFDEIDSTNRWLRDNCDRCTHGFVVDADFQTAGKGQATNRWESARGENLLFSLLLEPTKVPVAQQFLLSELVALATTDTLHELLGQEIRIKWPNDIYAGDCKLCGILIETLLNGNQMAKAIVGIGLNVNQTAFVSDAPNPISMQQIAGRPFDREQVLQLLTTRILDYYDQFNIVQASQWQQRYANALYRHTGLHPFRLPNGKTFCAAIDRIEPTGHLVLRNEKGILQTFAFKEVQFVVEASIKE